MKKSLKNILLAVFLLLTISITGCSKKEAVKDDRPVVYASFYPVYDLVSQIAGDTVNVKTFMPVDKDPHLWEPTAKDLKELSKADLLVVNGANLERWLDQVRDNIPNLKILTLSDYVELITYKGQAAMGDFSYMASHKAKKGEKFKFDFGHTHEDIMRVSFLKTDSKDTEQLIKEGKKAMNEKGKLVEQKATIQVEEGKCYALEMGHESGEIFYTFPEDGQWAVICDRQSEPILPYFLTDTKGNKLKLESLVEGSTSGMDKITYDPHSWLSTTNAKGYANAIRDTLSQLYPKNKAIYQKNKLQVAAKLTKIEALYKDKIKQLDDENKDFVVTHHAYEYLARDLGIRQYALQGLISTETPSLKTIKKALDFCKEKNIKTIFYEYGGQKKGADTLAGELEGHAEGLASMEYIYPGTDPSMHYTDYMEMNIKNIYNSMRRR